MKSNLLIVLLLAIVLVLGTSLVVRLLHPPITPTVEDGSERPTVIQLTVINASGVSGVAKRTMSFLRERGFDVVELGTSADTLARTAVVDRVGDRESTVKVARVLGLTEASVRLAKDSTAFVHASVIIGKDYPMLAPFKQ